MLPSATALVTSETAKGFRFLGIARGVSGEENRRSIIDEGELC